jgi:hypothetical protein
MKPMLARLVRALPDNDGSVILRSWPAGVRIGNPARAGSSSRIEQLDAPAPDVRTVLTT